MITAEQGKQLLLAEAQNILHQCMKVLHGKNHATYGPMTIHKVTRLSIQGTTTPYLIEIEIILGDGTRVFQAEYIHYTQEVVSFPNTRYGAANTYKLKAYTVFSYREGRWLHELTQLAAQTPVTGKQHNVNFEPIDDEKLWD